jgi:hypothetical protein
VGAGSARTAATTSAAGIRFRYSSAYQLHAKRGPAGPFSTTTIDGHAISFSTSSTP